MILKEGGEVVFLVNGVVRLVCGWFFGRWDLRFGLNEIGEGLRGGCGLS